MLVSALRLFVTEVQDGHVEAPVLAGEKFTCEKAAGRKEVASWKVESGGRAGRQPEAVVTFLLPTAPYS
jgi:hypothetical protein